MALPVEVMGHFTRSMDSSKAFAEGASLHNVCAAAGWSFRHIFIRFYRLDSTPGSQKLNRTEHKLKTKLNFMCLYLW